MSSSLLSLALYCILSSIVDRAEVNDLSFNARKVVFKLHHSDPSAIQECSAQPYSFHN
jgi:hypothetical protein